VEKWREKVKWKESRVRGGLAAGVRLLIKRKGAKRAPPQKRGKKKKRNPVRVPNTTGRPAQKVTAGTKQTVIYSLRNRAKAKKGKIQWLKKGSGS